MALSSEINELMKNTYASSFCPDKKSVWGKFKIILENLSSGQKILTKAKKFIFACEKDEKWLLGTNNIFFLETKSFYPRNNSILFS